MNEIVQFFSFFWEEDLDTVIRTVLVCFGWFMLAFFLSPLWTMWLDWSWDRKERKRRDHELRQKLLGKA